MADPNAIFQNCFYIGNQFNGILYGIQLSLYYTTLRLIRRERKRHGRNVGNERLFYLSTLFLFTATVHLAVQGIFGEEMWILNADYPGGNAAYFVDHSSVWYETMDTAVGVLMGLATDGYQIYRLWIVWDRDIRLILFPCLLYVASLALGIMSAVISSQPNSSFFAGLAAQIALAYIACSIGINVICAALVCGRIVWAGRQIRQTLGRESATLYAGTAALVVECMLPLALAGIAYIITNGIGHPSSILFFSFWEMTSCLAPQMLIVRVLSGRAYNPSLTQGVGSSMHFKSTNTVVGRTEDQTGSYTATKSTHSGAMRLNNLNKSDITVSKDIEFASV